MSLEPGVHNVDDPTYFADPALSHSDLRLLARSPAFYRWAKDNPDEQETTPALEFGKAVHSLVLGGPEVFAYEPLDGRTKAGKEAKAEREERRAAGAIALTVDAYERAEACRDALREHDLAGKLLRTATEFEVAVVWDDNGVRCRAKLDARAKRFGLDVKTTGNADPEAFGRSAAQYGYATQAAWYMEALRHGFGVDDPAFLFLCVEKDPPHLVSVVQLDPYDVELGARRNESLVALYRRCRDADEWPGYDAGIAQVTLPRWWEIEQETAA